jgi:hypothetical protein
MSKRKQVRLLAACACAAAAGLAAASGLVRDASAGSRPKSPSARTRAQAERVDIRLRSLTTRATGQLTVEASEGGGRVRLTAMNLPDPQTVAEGATTYVVWAVSGGRVLRLGELRRDERGNGGLAFDRPEGFERYGVIVTAEASADAERPSDPVLTTRADEAAALYPAPSADTPAPAPSPSPADAAGDADKANASDKSGRPERSDARGNAGAPGSKPPPATPSRAGGFYAEVEDAIAAGGGGRVVELEADSVAPGARGAARASYRSGSAYVRANFRGLPLPSAVGAGVYVLWGVLSDGRIVYMGSLPVTEDLNRAEVYVRVAGFDADDYTLFVTAEASRPAPGPSARRVLRPTNASFIVK